MIEHSPAPVIAKPTRHRRTPQQQRWLRVGFFFIDQILIFTGFALAYVLRYQILWPPPFDQIVAEVAIENMVPFRAFLPIVFILQVLLGARFIVRGFYRPSRRMTLTDEATAITGSVITMIALLIVVVFLYRPFFYSRLIFAFAAVTIIVLLLSWRILLIGIRHWFWSRGLGRERVVVVGSTGLGQLVMHALTASPGAGYTLVGYLSDQPIISGNRARVFHHLGDLHDLEQVIEAYHIQQVIIALPFWQYDQLPELVARCQHMGIEYQIAPDIYQLSFDRVDIMHLSGVPLLQPKEIQLHGLNLFFKRTFDLAAVLLTLPITVPLAAIIALVIWLDSGRPIIFRQQRVGKNGRLFTCYKFRTMIPDAEQRRRELLAYNEADGPLFKMRDDPRVTRVGRWLRRTSLDELPQLFNVLLGDMSLIGPRPALPEEVERYEPWHHRRLAVQPGLACLPQALGRSEISFDEQVRLDIYYAENWTFSLDLRILMMVIPAILSGRGAW
ncbi:MULTISPECIES: sugar transferase [Chloroflexus]|jgi:exopolysaccharide biosynthesis polyprenyl glycosylphosphotransferase|uniref:Exopolysaccharide biosynthesis polyprenyl glycosylphosphotransferase n=1 Tax=Chloroflexus aggregans (strain MD-66 / DSM 9485) TaxID=326427 RepID=B8GCP4_CHLAD|nr:MULTISPECIES: sugar transferase [Chloroflexus]ACL23094.1 exopolysaccharide biosynthesis polyprenyl glycosylphosphotransferase [Chloroflexus aggregans DSM 9485]GIV89489.1 MAG: UDP-phosphate galactose phosphotransferase [Chloroflexus sp.]